MRSLEIRAIRRGATTTNAIPGRVSMELTCMRCGSKDIVRDVRVVDRGEGNSKTDLKLEVYENPDALIFKGTHKARLSADVCADCGFAMLSVSAKAARELKKHGKLQG